MLADNWPCRDPYNSDSFRNGLRYTSASPDNCIVSNYERAILCPIKDYRARTNINAFAEMNPTGNMNARSKCCIVAQNSIMPDCTIQVDLNVLAYSNINSKDITRTYDSSSANLESIR